MGPDGCVKMQGPQEEPEIIDLTGLDSGEELDLTQERPWTEPEKNQDDRPWDNKKEAKKGKKKRKGKTKKTTPKEPEEPEEPEEPPEPKPKKPARIHWHTRRKFTREIPTLREAARTAERRLSEKGYSAVEAHGWFGLIDAGCPSRGVRELTAHTPRHNGGFTLDRLRPGQDIRLKSARNEDGATLRIRFTTPERYYAPGRKITTLSIGVDDAAWQRLINPV